MGVAGESRSMNRAGKLEIFVWLVVILLFICPLKAEVRDVVIMQTTDMHGVFDDGDSPQDGSWLRIATMVKKWRQSEGAEKCLLIDCGDNVQGTLTTALSKGMAGIVPLETMKYDAWIPGNHELDYGVERFGELTGRVKGIVLCGNLQIKGAEAFPAWRMFERNGVKVAVIGVSASYAKNWMLAEEYKKLEVETAFATLERIMPQVHQAKPDVIVLATHQAWFEGADTRGVNEISKIAKCFPEIDVILGAHSHRLLPGRRIGKRSWYMQPGCHGECLGIVRVTVDTERHAVVSIEGRMQTVTKDYAEDEELRAALAEYLDAAKVERKRLIKGSLSMPVRAYGRPGVSCETSELICRSLAEASGADVVLHGRLSKKDLSAGRVTAQDLFELVPYENSIVTAEVTREELGEIVAEQWRNKTHYSFCGLWGADAKLGKDAQTAVITRLWKGAWPDGGRVKLALNNHTAAGSGRFTVLRGILDKPESHTQDTKIMTRDAVEAYLSKRENLVISVGKD